MATAHRARSPVCLGKHGEDPPPYLFVSTVAIPALRADGVADDVIDTMLRDVPRRFLSGET